MDTTIKILWKSENFSFYSAFHHQYLITLNISKFQLFQPRLRFDHMRFFFFLVNTRLWRQKNNIFIKISAPEENENPPSSQETREWVEGWQLGWIHDTGTCSSCRLQAVGRSSLGMASGPANRQPCRSWICCLMWHKELFIHRHSC